MNKWTDWEEQMDGLEEFMVCGQRGGFEGERDLCASLLPAAPTHPLLHLRAVPFSSVSPPPAPSRKDPCSARERMCESKIERRRYIWRGKETVREGVRDTDRDRATEKQRNIEGVGRDRGAIKDHPPFRRVQADWALTRAIRAAPDNLLAIMQ